MSRSDPTSDQRPSDDCCTSAERSPRDPRIARHFDTAIVERAAGGPPPIHAVSQHLLDQLTDVKELRPTLLELGCGSGALTVALLEAGASDAHCVDLSAGSLDVARRRADSAGVGTQTTFEVGDGARVSLLPHDWVILDRVMCCYPDVHRLLANAIPAAMMRFAFSVPTSRGWRGVVNRIWSIAEYWITRLQRRACPGYIHDLDFIEERLSAAGFRHLRSRTDGLWYTAVFERSVA